MLVAAILVDLGLKFWSQHLCVSASGLHGQESKVLDEAVARGSDLSDCFTKFLGQAVASGSNLGKYETRILKQAELLVEAMLQVVPESSKH